MGLFESGGWSTWSASIDSSPSKLSIGTDNIYTAATDEARRLINVEPKYLGCCFRVHGLGLRLTFSLNPKGTPKP